MERIHYNYYVFYFASNLCLSPMGLAMCPLPMLPRPMHFFFLASEFHPYCSWCWYTDWLLHHWGLHR